MLTEKREKIICYNVEQCQRIFKIRHGFSPIKKDKNIKSVNISADQCQKIFKNLTQIFTVVVLNRSLRSLRSVGMTMGKVVGMTVGEVVGMTVRKPRVLKHTLQATGSVGMAAARPGRPWHTL